MFSLAVDEYVKMEGTWGLKARSNQYHANFQEAKRHCSLADNCFGIQIGVNIGGYTYSFNFPIRLQEGGPWYINKKESTSGNFIYQEC